MTGVEILNETQVVAESAFGWTAFWKKATCAGRSFLW